MQNRKLQQELDLQRSILDLVRKYPISQDTLAATNSTSAGDTQVLDSQSWRLDFSAALSNTVSGSFLFFIRLFSAGR